MHATHPCHPAAQVEAAGICQRAHAAPVKKHSRPIRNYSDFEKFTMIETAPKRGSERCCFGLIPRFQVARMRGMSSIAEVDDGKIQSWW